MNDGETGARWSLLASSIAERALDVRPSTDGPAWTDGLTVYVTTGDDGPRTAVEVAVQAALLRRGSLEPAVVRRLRGRATVTRRYLAWEGWAAAAALGPELPDLVAALGPVPDDVSPSPAESLARAERGGPDPHDWFGAVRPRALLAARSAADGDGEGSTELTGSFTDAAIRELADDEDSDDPGAIMRLLSAPTGGSNPFSRLFSRLLGLARRPGEGPPGGELQTGAARAVGRRPGMVLGRLEAIDATTPAPVAPGLVAYPEWDVHAQRHRPGWCLVRELVPARAPASPPPADADVERAVARIGLARQRVRRRPEGHELDLDAVIEAVVTARTGGQPSRGVHLDNTESRRDLGVLVLLDASGSTGDDAGGRPLFDRQVAAAGSLVREFHDVGARTAFYGFQSSGRHHVHLLRLKAFDEPCAGMVWARAASVTPAAYTRMGTAVRHAAHVLTEEAGTDRRLLLVLSDGYPYDDGYEAAYAEADVRRALAEARAVGVGCVCLSLGSADASTLARVFGSAGHASLTDERELRAVLPRLCRASLRQAAARQHRARRADRPASARLAG